MTPFLVVNKLGIQTPVQFSSVQFKMVSMHSGRPICTPPCLSGVPNVALETVQMLVWLLHTQTPEYNKRCVDTELQIVVRCKSLAWQLQSPMCKMCKTTMTMCMYSDVSHIKLTICKMYMQDSQSWPCVLKTTMYIYIFVYTHTHMYPDRYFWQQC